MRSTYFLIPLFLLSGSAYSFDPIGEGLDAAGKLNPFDFSSTTTNPAKPDVVPPEPQSPCDGKTIRPDSAGNFMFSVKPGGASTYSIEFSKNGADWNLPINDSMDFKQISGQQVPVDAGKLLIINKNWHWRTASQTAGKKLVSKHNCKIVIEPSGGAQMLTPPILVSPACGSQAMGNTVVFDAKPGGGAFQIFRAELQYNRMVGGMPGNWMGSGLLTAIDKNHSKFGVVIPVDELAKHGGKWRWRARLDNEKMPLFGNLTQGEWSPWCEFTVPVKRADFPDSNRPPIGSVPPPGAGGISTMPATGITPAGPIAPLSPLPAARSLPPPPQPVMPAGSVQPMPALPNLPAVQQPAERRSR